ncbi:MAG: SAM-dependent methyltransferase [Maritimibacter sp.]|nr:SAM-dependent methyltransferase [Maritimibacter sp.]
MRRARGFRLDRAIARPDVQSLLARLPVARWMARRDGADIFDILQGFVASQVLSALMEFGVLHRLLDRPDTLESLALTCGLSREKMDLLLRAGVALRLLKKKRNGRYALARRGAAILGVPGLEAMIAHNRAFYRDMSDPAALLRGSGETELAGFWSYVLDAGHGVQAEEAQRYSELMAGSQALVAEDTLRQVSLKGVGRLMDVGGGAGAFLDAALTAYPDLSAMLLDLPDVVRLASNRFSQSGRDSRVTLYPRSFRTGPLPEGADAISLVRVLYDHEDRTVADLLARAFVALPPGGRLIVSEPMSGGRRPDRATDVYFAFYTMAMGTGRVRSQARVAGMLREAGFDGIETPRTRRSFVTSVVTAVKPT